MPEAVGASIREPSQGYQLRVVQEVLLALLASEPSHGYQLRSKLQLALGPLAGIAAIRRLIALKGERSPGNIKAA